MPQTTNSVLQRNNTWTELAERFATKIEQSQILSTFDKQKFKDWFMEREQVGILFDYKLMARTYAIWKELANESDHFIVVVGKEGLGKTTLSLQVSSWINPTMDIDDIAFDMEQYVTTLKGISKEHRKNKATKHFRTITLDEGGISLFSRESMSRSNVVLAKTFMVQRYLNVGVTICIPYYWALDSMIRDHRIKTLIIIKERGKYKCVTGAGIRRLNLTGSKNRDRELQAIQLPYGTFWDGDFSKSFPGNIKEEDYDKHKHKHINRFLDDAELEATTFKMVKATKIAKEIGIDIRTLVNQIQNGEIEGRRIGDRWFVTEKAYKKIMMA